MLKHLALKNLVLIESCEVEFQPGFNIISGETGAGKTALIEGIKLALGQRADSTVIRKGEEKALVEASFDISQAPKIVEILEEAGIESPTKEYLVIRREITRSGKNRAFVQCQMATLPLLQKIGHCLIDLVGQHSHQGLRSSESQRELLDIFADSAQELEAFQNAWAAEKAQLAALEALELASFARQRELDICKFEWEEIESANLREGEEEAIAEEHTRLAHAHELSEKLQMTAQALSDSLLASLNRHKSIVQSLSAFDVRLKETSGLIQEGYVSLQEASCQIQTVIASCEFQPKRFEFLEERLAIIQKIKKKYGTDFQQIAAYRQQLKEKLNRLENLDNEIENAKSSLESLKAATAQFANKLSAVRKRAANAWQKQLTTAVQELNMPKAEFQIAVSSQARSASGEDAVHFWLAPNVGESPALVKDSSSGGELSRLMLAIKTTLAEKNQTPTIIFDEIDANVGGETASQIGLKLQELGKVRQILCITHFPQVAAQAHHHLLVRKQENAGRTLSTISTLNVLEKEKELLRMLGGKKNVHMRS